MSSDIKSVLLKKIEDKSFTVGVIGQGYVGLPLALCFAEKGFTTVGLDIDQTKVQRLNKGESYIKHIPGDRVSKSVKSGKFTATADFSKIRECDGVLICVPTPLTKHREPDMSYIVSTCEAIVPHMRRGQLFVLESTTYPGTTVEVVIPILESANLKSEIDFYAAFSPEREDPNNPNYTTETIPKVVGGTSPDALAVADKLYGQIVVRTVPVSSTQVAESTKLLENIFRSVNIALVNELKVAFMKMGIDIWEVIGAAKTKPFGFMPFYPGPGLGGHCIPIDPFYLTWKAREFDVTTRFIELAGEINTGMPDFVVSRCTIALNDRRKSLKNSRILVLGLTYKPDIDDIRESPSLHIMEKLEQAGAQVCYNDPYVAEIPNTREHKTLAGRKSVYIERDFDLLVIATAHKEYLQMNLVSYGVPIVDTRNVIRGNSSLLYKG